MASKQKIIISGSNGQLGKSLKAISSISPFKENKYKFFSKEELDISMKDDFKQIKDSFDIFINCAAYTNVSKAESDINECMSINFHAVKNIVKYCNQNNSSLIHISTDYVFDGSSEDGYFELDNPNPINIYGKSKQLAEEYIQQHCKKYRIIRTSWVYSEYGNNFVRTILNKLSSSEDLNLIDDQIGCPTYAPELARYINNISMHEDHEFNDIVHFSSMDSMSWFTFGNLIKKIYLKLGCFTDSKIIPISSKNYADVVKRPKYSILKSRIKNLNYLNLHNSNEKCLENIVKKHIDGLGKRFAV